MTLSARTSPPPGAPSRLRESTDTDRWSPISQSLPSGTTAVNSTENNVETGAITTGHNSADSYADTGNAFASDPLCVITQRTPQAMVLQRS